jgi:hypothetical protein
MTLPLHTTLPTRMLLMLAVAAVTGLAVWVYAPNATSWFDGSAGNASAAPMLKVDGDVELVSDNGMVSRLVVPLTVSGDERILLTEGRRLHASTFMSETAAAAVPAQYTLAWFGGNGDEFLDPGERAVLTVNLPVPSPVRPENPVEIIIRPVDGLPLVIRDVLP